MTAAPNLVQTEVTSVTWCHIAAHINQLAKGQSIKATDSAALQSLSRQMLKCELTLSQMGFDADLNKSETLLGLMDRLPPYLQRKWMAPAETIFRVGKRPCFSDLNNNNNNI